MVRRRVGGPPRNWEALGRSQCLDSVDDEGPRGKMDERRRGEGGQRLRTEAPPPPPWGAPRAGQGMEAVGRTLPRGCQLGLGGLPSIASPAREHGTATGNQTRGPPGARDKLLGCVPSCLPGTEDIIAPGRRKTEKSFTKPSGASPRRLPPRMSLKDDC